MVRNNKPDFILTLSSSWIYGATLYCRIPICPSICPIISWIVAMQNNLRLALFAFNDVTSFGCQNFYQLE
jgi:hypothetical protein